LGHTTDKCGTYSKCESGLNYHLCFTLGEGPHLHLRCRSVGHTQNVSLDSQLYHLCCMCSVQAHKCRTYTKCECGLNYHLCCVLCSGSQVWDIPKMSRRTWLAPCPYAPYSMNILTLGCCPKGKKFLSVFGGHLKPEGLLPCRGSHLFLFKKENYCILNCFVHVKHKGFFFKNYFSCMKRKFSSDAFHTVRPTSKTKFQAIIDLRV
jgi:hypothetical protein